MSEYKCPHCHNPIYDEDALLCHFCGQSLERAGKGFLGKVRYANHRVIWFFMIFVILAGFIFWMLR